MTLQDVKDQMWAILSDCPRHPGEDTASAAARRGHWDAKVDANVGKYEDADAIGAVMLPAAQRWRVACQQRGWRAV